MGAEIKNSTHYVYLITNKITKQQYVGDRTCYCDVLEDIYLGSGVAIKLALKEYGKRNFEKQILEIFPSRKEAFDSQSKYIQKYNTLKPNGYNISPKGGCYCEESVSEETKQQIRKTLLGRSRSEETKALIKKNTKIGMDSKEVKEKIRNSKLGKTQSPESIENRISQLRGKIRPSFSDTWKINLSNSAKKRKKKQCIYCNRYIDPVNYSKYHGEKCKQK